MKHNLKLLLSLTLVLNTSVAFLQNPGNVSTGLELWFKANVIAVSDGSLTTTWLDYSGKGNDASQTDSDKQPYFRDNVPYNLNFNATVDFVRDDGDKLKSDRLEFNTPTDKTQTIFLVFETEQIEDRASWHYKTPIIYGGDVNPGRVTNQADFCVGLGDWYGTGDKLAFGGGGFDDYYIKTSNAESIISTALPVILTVDRDDISNDEFDLAWRINGLLGGTYNLPQQEVASPMPPISVLGNHMTNLADAFDGSISEVVVYDGVLNYANKNKVESYLAIKYGVTLDQSSPQDYVLGDGTISWNSAVVPVAYNNDIAGISRDDVSAQYQKQSKSENPGSLVTIGLGPIVTTNTVNSGVFTTDRHTLTWSNNRDANAWVLTELPPGIAEKLEREWFTEENIGDVGTVTIEVAAADLAPTAGIVNLLIDEDGAFAVGATIIPMSLNAGIWSVDVNFTDEYYFSFGIPVVAPLGVQGLQFNATPTKELVKLEWITVSETNNETFTVERSKYGIEWEEVVTQKGSGTTTENRFYSDLDELPYSGLSYYRLKQIDFNGQFTFSTIQPVNFNEPDFILYPNPVNDILVIEGEINGVTLVKITNMLGQNVSYDANIIEKSSTKLKLDISNLTPGVYMIRLGSEVMQVIVE